MRSFRRNKQAGSAGDIIFAILFLVVGLIFAHGTMTANYQEVQALADSARNNPKALATIKAALEKTPTPTNRELERLRGKVNEQILLQTSKEVTGNPDLKTEAQVLAQQREIEAQKPQGFFNMDPVNILFRCMVLLVALWLGLHIFRSMLRGKDGR